MHLEKAWRLCAPPPHTLHLSHLTVLDLYALKYTSNSKQSTLLSSGPGQGYGIETPDFTAKSDRT